VHVNDVFHMHLYHKCMVEIYVCMSMMYFTCIYIINAWLRNTCVYTNIDVYTLGVG